MTTIMASRLTTMSVLALALAGCLITTNEDFDETEDEGGGDEPCTEQTIDCDDVPGCESEIDDPRTCGSCEHSCSFGGDLLECNEGVCSGTALIDNLDDTHTHSEMATIPLGDSETLYVGTNWGTRHTYLELPAIFELPEGAELFSVQLYLACNSAGSTIDVHRVLTGWDEDELTWINAPAVDETVLLSFDPVWGDNLIDLTPILSAWDGQQNYGIALRSMSDANNDKDTQLHSSESEMEPRLSVTLSW